jgi:head-tail adaptor
MIGGNISAVIQTREIHINAIGEQVNTWKDAVTLKGFLDLSGGSAQYAGFNAKIQESTHFFICDFVPLPESVTAENSRMIIRNKIYNITLIDNPMELNKHLEIYLKYTGGQ